MLSKPPIMANNRTASSASFEGVEMEYIAIFIAFVFPGALVAFNHNLPQSLIAMVCFDSKNEQGAQVIINGAAKEIGRAAVIAVTKARGMEVAGAVDSYLVCDMEKPLEIPIMNDLTMVLGSISQWLINKHEHHGPIIVVIECPNAQSIKSGVRALDDFPCVLGWQQVVAKIGMQRCAATSQWLNERISLSRYAHGILNLIGSYIHQMSSNFQEHFVISNRVVLRGKVTDYGTDGYGCKIHVKNAKDCGKGVTTEVDVRKIISKLMWLKELGAFGSVAVKTHITPLTSSSIPSSLVTTSTASTPTNPPTTNPHVDNSLIAINLSNIFTPDVGSVSRPSMPVATYPPTMSPNITSHTLPYSTSPFSLPIYSPTPAVTTITTASPSLGYTTANNKENIPPTSTTKRQSDQLSMRQFLKRCRNHNSPFSGHRAISAIFQPIDSRLQQEKRKSRFRFEKIWLSDPQSKEIITASWNSSSITDPIATVIGNFQDCAANLQRWHV
ncbi:hypothetical protein F8388_020116, partial [Cannabis sativa]